MPGLVNMEELDQKGYTVVENVLSGQDCDRYIHIYQDWLSQFKPGDWPRSAHSLIQRYRIGHMEPSWGVRLETKKVFEEIWGTDQLLTSFDAVAVGRPPEGGEEDFADGSGHWLHCDQGVERMGLHAFQGGVYLEDADADDWTFEILEGSHALHGEFFDSNPRAKIRCITNKHYTLRDEDVGWYLSHAEVTRKRVPVPKGGMILWDSRLIHANARPISGRKHPGRWRYVVFVCMAPAVWTTKRYVREKKDAYNNLKLTTHWPCDGMATFYDPEPESGIRILQELPEVARSDSAKRLAGVLPYSGPRRGPAWSPQWVRGSGESQCDGGTTLAVSVAIIAVTLAVITMGLFKVF